MSSHFTLIIMFNPHKIPKVETIVIYILLIDYLRFKCFAHGYASQDLQTQFNCRNCALNPYIPRPHLSTLISVEAKSSPVSTKHTFHCSAFPLLPHLTHNCRRALGPHQPGRTKIQLKEGIFAPRLECLGQKMLQRMHWSAGESRTAVPSSPAGFLFLPSDFLLTTYIKSDPLHQALNCSLLSRQFLSSM